MDCPNCGAGLGERKAFCTRCGTAVLTTCDSCGGQNPRAAQFCGDCGAKLQDRPAVDVARRPVRPAPPPPPSAPPTVERRQLTVMFCDLVGSTALSTRLDLEDLHDAITAYQSCVDEIVGQFDGFVARHLGDGILIFFGYPLAQEDDAERAVRAGLAIVESVSALRVPDAAMQVRIGIATGTVVIGEFVSAQATQRPDVIGEAPNLAARLQSIAEPDTVLIADATRRLVGSLFEDRDLGRTTLKGFADDVQVWQVLRPRAIRNRFEALRATPSLPLVGREAEMGLLLARWRLAASGSGQVVLLTGEPGIGKSRIMEALRLALCQEAAHTATYSCAPSGRNSPLDPFVHGLRTDAGLEGGEAAAVQLAKLRSWVGDRVADPAQAVPLLGELLSIPGAGLAAPTSISPQRRKEIALECVLDLIVAPAGHGPALLLVEDLHWADPTSIELIGLLVERTRAAPMLVVATSRAEFLPDWADPVSAHWPHVTLLPVGRLGRAENAALIRNVVGGKSLPPEVAELILSRTDGVPLFVEELTKATLESGLLREEASGYTLAGSFSRLDIPSTLHDSLMARLDRLGNVKAVAQIGAAIGRSFSFRQLSAVAEMPEGELNTALSRLSDAALVLCERELPDAIYTFRHALVQDVAYASLLRRDRVQLHGRIVGAFERLFPDMRDAQPELLAQHYEAAGLIVQAIICWLRAGEKARQRSALREAVEHLTQGLNAVASLPPSPARDRHELDLRAALGSTYMALKGWAAAEVETVLTPAHALCHSLGETARLPNVLRVLWQYHATRGNDRVSSALVTEMQAAAAAGKNDPLLVLNAAYAAASSHFWRGEFAAAGEHAKKLAGYDFERDRHFVAIIQSDVKTTTMTWESYRLWIEGFPDLGAEAAAEQDLHARRLEHPFNLCFALTVGSVVHALRRDPLALRARTSEASRIAREQSIPFVHSVLAPLFESAALVEQGQCEAAVTQNRAGLARWRATGGRLIGPYHLAVIADGLLCLGRFDEGLAAITEALGEAASMNERWAEADLWRLKGDLLVGSGAIGDAIVAYETGLRIARAQGARSWELRGAMGLAALRAVRGERRAALALIEPVLDWFREGLDTPDLRRAVRMVRDFA